MKKLFIIIVINLQLSNFSFANEITYYCVDDRAGGYQGSDIGDTRKPIMFRPGKFKVQFNESSDSLLMIMNEVKTTLKTYHQYKFFYTNSFDTTLVFHPLQWETNKQIRHYVRSHTLPKDSLYVAQGKCEKF